MSQKNVEHLIERTADALNRGDVDAFAACCHPDVDWEENSSAYIGVRQHNRGRTGAREWFQEAILDVWESWHVTLLEMTKAGEDRVLVLAAVTGRGEGSGVETTQHFWSAFWLRSDLIVRRQVFLNEAEARSAVGSEE
jgi:ketosteroid isomerase-like protein